jgi:hypothetical protein
MFPELNEKSEVISESCRPPEVRQSRLNRAASMFGFYPIHTTTRLNLCEENFNSVLTSHTIFPKHIPFSILKDVHALMTYVILYFLFRFFNVLLVFCCF